MDVPRGGRGGRPDVTQVTLTWSAAQQTTVGGCVQAPGLQFYTGNFLTEKTVGKGGVKYFKHAGELRLYHSHQSIDDGQAVLDVTRLQYGAWARNLTSEHNHA